MYIINKYVPYEARSTIYILGIYVFYQGETQIKIITHILGQCEYSANIQRNIFNDFIESYFGYPFFIRSSTITQYVHDNIPMYIPVK